MRLIDDDFIDDDDFIEDDEADFVDLEGILVCTKKEEDDDDQNCINVTFHFDEFDRDVTIPMFKEDSEIFKVNKCYEISFTESL
jgi:hypothetical protein